MGRLPYLVECKDIKGQAHPLRYGNGLCSYRKWYVRGNHWRSVGQLHWIHVARSHNRMSPRFNTFFLALFFGALVCPLTNARTIRSASSIAEFKHQQPCPSTGRSRGACPGYVIDHIEPLCAGGPDIPSNMQWQSVDEAKAKDKIEVRQCAAMRREKKG